MKRLTLILTLVVSLMLILAALPAAAQEGSEHGSDDQAALRGAAVYATYCQACHGPTGEAIGTGPAFAEMTYDHDTARDVIGEGIAGTESEEVWMPAYADVLDDAALDDLMAYMDTWETHTTPPLPHPNLHDVPDHVQDYAGDPHEGAVVYASFCAGCHGANGEGERDFDSPKIELTLTTVDFVAEEHSPAFGTESGGPLSEEQLTDLEAYMASWAEDKAESEDSGINLLIVVMGVVAILLVGFMYTVRRGEPAPET